MWIKALGMYLVKKLNSLLKKPSARTSTTTRAGNHATSKNAGIIYAGQPPHGLQPHATAAAAARDLFSSTRNSSHRASYASSTGSTSQLITGNKSSMMPSMASMTPGFHPSRFIESVTLAVSPAGTTTTPAAIAAVAVADKYKSVPNFV